MKYYATEDGFVHDHKVNGGVEITIEQYNQAIDASVNGTGRGVLEGKKFTVKSVVEKTVYSTENGTPLIIYADDPIPDGYCEKERVDYQSEWNGTDWITPESVLTMREIYSLESQITPRRLREATLGDADSIAFIQDIEDQIIELRGRS